MTVKLRCLELSVLLLVLASSAFAKTWYVDGVNGSDNNNCETAAAACATIGHAISLAASGDTVMLAPANYAGGISIPFSLTLTGAGSSTTFINGGLNGSSVVTIPPNNPVSQVTISGVTIQGGNSIRDGGGISNYGALTVNDSAIHRNTALFFGGGISTHSVETGLPVQSSLFVNRTIISGNQALEGGGIECSVPDSPTRINNSTIVGNEATGGNGGGILNGFGYPPGKSCGMTITNSTIFDNQAAGIGGGMYGNMEVYSSTISGNFASFGGSDIFGGVAVLNTIVANSNGGANCGGSVFSNGYSLSSDETCHFTAPGDLINTDPLLDGDVHNNGGPTTTIRLLPGSPAIDAGNPKGCVAPSGSVLTADQRGDHRPGDPKLTTGCDIGAYEYQFPK